ncbi:hypothetical protein D1224_11790 [Henriciella barbarensis]|uniref:DUF2007 domain-containing protein n=1 Tax=Henriciella barbarensis TaxID=86342 RepID=A0A399QTY6_9PROT|nr:hypothetical protein [Henriciella barbarensis]RIJ22230.1 hypothetical protein D1224_11790 [Henriciella barbarensis]
MAALVTIRRCATLQEALVCKGFLEANGIHAIVENYYHASNDWLLIPGLGGACVAVPSNDVETAHALIRKSAQDGADLLEQEFGAYETPHRYGVLALWYMILHQFQVALFLWVCFFYVLLKFLDAVVPSHWFISKAPTIERDWIPEVSAGSWNPISMSGWNIEGFLFVIVIILVFVADRLITPGTDTKDEAP